jgi:hypothetical protein
MAHTRTLVRGEDGDRPERGGGVRSDARPAAGDVADRVPLADGDEREPVDHVSVQEQLEEQRDLRGLGGSVGAGERLCVDAEHPLAIGSREAPDHHAAHGAGVRTSGAHPLDPH